mmetsp:Transcript_36784/g.109850  ORF Transcript_36784/g.109850 Transcript_36784/m.109850 type:complete len:366 (-) Transcript_36784:17-1114(-)
MPGADGMSSKFMKNAFVGWTFTAGLYYPPDFDQSKLMPMKHLRPKGPQLMNIRMMFPFTMVCDSCHEYNYTGTKFTAKVEHIKQESYLGLKVYRFYGRCRHCWSEFTFKTDPKNSDYTMESGGKRTYEAWKDADMMEAQLREEKQREAEQDPMKALEQKTIDVQAEMQRLEDLDAIRTVNKRLGARDQTIEEALEFLFQREEKRAALEDRLPEGDQAELEGFREAQEERRRRKLEDEVEGPREEAAGSSAASNCSGGSSGSAAPARGGASGASAAIASAVAERASQTANKATSVGARFSIKRKAPAEDGEDVAAKRQEVASAAAEADATAASTATPVDAAASGAGSSAAAPSHGLGLGAYDSGSE